MSNDTGGNVEHSIEDDIAAFDKLSPTFRKLVRNCDNRMSSVETLRHVQAGHGLRIAMYLKQHTT